ncbi:hypothetical protein PQX77_002605 [Marasmius sp. AFHP31]|nr:hypothetical protein PQX77_002605 [Marasmius sp. AFHP31]
MHLLTLLTSLLSICLILLCGHAKTITRYIDDSYGDPSTGFLPIYYPSSPTTWKDQTCTRTQGGCVILPDTRLTINGTYTAATYTSGTDNMGFTLRFNGTGIAVYFVLANDDYGPGITTRTECNFTLDGAVRKSYVHEPRFQGGLEYNVEVYKEEGLESRYHTLDVSTGKRPYDIYIAFDYATYTVEEPDEVKQPASSNSEHGDGAPVGAIVGGVVGGVLLLSGLIFLAVLWRRRRAQLRQHLATFEIDEVVISGRITPFNGHSGPTLHDHIHSGCFPPSPHSGFAAPLLGSQPYTGAHMNAPSTAGGSSYGDSTVTRSSSPALMTPMAGHSGPSEKRSLLLRQQQLDEAPPPDYTR